MPPKKPKSDTNQLSFNLSVSAEDMFELKGGTNSALSDFDFRLRQSIKECLEKAAKRKDDPLDRTEVAKRMSALLGRDIKKSQVDEWTAMATVSRRIHVDALRAICEVTEDLRPIYYFVESCGLRALTPDLARCAEWGASEVLRRSLASKQKSLGVELEDPSVIKALSERLLSGGTRD
jgi:hypothetical protein